MEQSNAARPLFSENHFKKIPAHDVIIKSNIINIYEFVISVIGRQTRPTSRAYIKTRLVYVNISLAVFFFF